MDGDEADFDGFKTPNPTMMSLDKGLVVIVTPEDPAFFRNPIEVTKAIESSPFSKHTFQRIHSNKKSKLVVFEVFEEDKDLKSDFKSSRL